MATTYYKSRHTTKGKTTLQTMTALTSGQLPPHEGENGLRGALV